MDRQLKQRLIAALVLLVIAHALMTSKVEGSGGDSAWFVLSALSIVHQGNLDLNEYEGFARRHEAYRYGIVERDGRTYQFFPPGTTFLLVPFVAATEFVLHALGAESLDEHVRRAGTERFEKVLASVWMWFAALGFFILARRHGSFCSSIFSTLVFALGSSVWSELSQAIWSQTAMLLVLVWGLVWLIHQLSSDGNLAGPGAVLGFAFAVRPTAAIPLVFLVLLVWWQARPRVLQFLTGMSISGLALAAFSLTTYGSILPPYYGAGRVGWHSSLPEALIGTLVSPSRGLFVFSPVFLLGLAALPWTLRRRPIKPILLVGLASTVSLWLLVSSFPQWWGGHCFGPRLLADAIPWLALTLVPLFDAITSLRSARRYVGLALLLLVTLWSGLVNYRGANSWACRLWNVAPVDVDVAPKRVWDWKDPQFLRGRNPWRQGGGQERRESLPRRGRLL